MHCVFIGRVWDCGCRYHRCFEGTVRRSRLEWHLSWGKRVAVQSTKRCPGSFPHSQNKIGQHSWLLPPLRHAGPGVHLQHAHPRDVETGNQGPKPTTKVDKRPRAETNEEMSEHDWVRAGLHTGNRCHWTTPAGQAVVLYVPWQEGVGGAIAGKACTVLIWCLITSPFRRQTWPGVQQLPSPDRNLIITITVSVGTGTGAAFMTHASSGAWGSEAVSEKETVLFQFPAIAYCDLLFISEHFAPVQRPSSQFPTTVPARARPSSALR